MVLYDNDDEVDYFYWSSEKAMKRTIINYKFEANSE